MRLICHQCRVAYELCPMCAQLLVPSANAERARAQVARGVPRLATQTRTPACQKPAARAYPGVQVTEISSPAVPLITQGYPRPGRVGSSAPGAGCSPTHGSAWPSATRGLCRRPRPSLFEPARHGISRCARETPSPALRSRK